MMQGGKAAILRVSIGSRRGALTFQRVFGKLARFGYRRKSRMHSLARKLALLGLFLALPAVAQEFPSRPITLICPWPAGGSTDTHLRRFAEIAAKYLGQTVLIENRPGGGGTVGPGHLAQTAKADGYTLSQMHMGAFRVPHMQKLAWDPVRDFTYIIGLSGYTFGVVVKSDSPFKTFSDLLDYARANPGKLSYGSTGTGTSPHLLMEEVSMKTGVQFLHVPFKGNADSTQALLGDHIMAQSDSSGWGRFVDAGQFRLLVTFGSSRTKHWPSVPTANDLGLDMVYSSPYGIVGPRGMEPRVVKILHDGFKKALDDPEQLKVLDQLDQELWYQSSEDYAKYARETFQKERALIERLGLLAK
jgi:tripartite-type tricarboxylate transporter receptor subunit TctC